jgi:signal transduction histidine kinase
LELLHEIDRGLLSAHSAQEIAMGALTRIRQLIPCQRASITLFDFTLNQAEFLVTSFDVQHHNAGRKVITLQEYGQYIIDELLQNKPCRIDDILADSRATELDRELALAGFRVWLYLPLLNRGQLIGSVNLARNSGSPFTAEDTGIVHDVANQLAITIQQTRLYSTLQNELEERKALIEELRLRNTESETLRESAAIVAATLDQSETVALILEQLEKVVLYDSASVQLLKGDMLEIVSSRGVDFNDCIGTQFKLDQNEPAYPVLLEKVPYILYEDVQASIPTFNEIPHHNIQAWMAIPLKVKGQIIGIIALDGYQIGQFSERDAELAVTYANQVAIALENARLFTELQAKYAERQQLIEELETKNAELERLTYTVSHDLKSPLVTIKGFLGYIERDAATGNAERLKGDIQRISDAVETMRLLLNDLLEFSRIGRVANPPEVVSFGEMANEAVTLVQGRIIERNIEVHVAAGMPPVFGDKKRLLEVLQNLVDNAAKFMGDEQKPKIEIGWLGEDTELGKPVFFVRDNGIGISPKYHERVFGLFNKLHPDIEGTGIGLALVKRIIEVHGGRIWVESEVGKGSTFYFSLPVTMAKEKDV